MLRVHEPSLPVVHEEKLKLLDIVDNKLVKACINRSFKIYAGCISRHV